MRPSHAIGLSPPLGATARSRTVATEVIFGNDAIINGRVKVGFEDFQPEDPALAHYKGLVTEAGAEFPWRVARSARWQHHAPGSLLVRPDEGYFVGTGGKVTYTQRVVGPLDVQVLYGVMLQDYGHREGLPPGTDTTRTYGGGIGLNRSNGSRFGVNYEDRAREARAADESYRRRRVFASYTYLY